MENKAVQNAVKHNRTEGHFLPRLLLFRKYSLHFLYGYDIIYKLMICWAYVMP